MKTIRICLAAAVFVLTLFSLQRLLMPKYMSELYEGALTAEYYNEPVKDHDVLFVGDCELYENISPVTLWENYGFTSYIRGSAQQLMWQTYYLLEEALQYERPEVVVISVLAMKYDQPQSEAYNRLTIDGMKSPGGKLGAARASMTEGESLLSYLLPVLRYHDRWRELSAEDFVYFFKPGSVAVNGFMMRCDVKPATVTPEGPKLPSYRFGGNSYAYLDKITALCKENGVELMLVKAPSLYPYWYDEWDDQITGYASQNGLVYVNLLKQAQDAGLDFSTDTYDGGLHLNLSGAEKLSVYLGGIMTRTYDLPDRRGQPDTSGRWERKLADYRLLKSVQMSELEKYGKVFSKTLEQARNAVS